MKKPQTHFTFAGRRIPVDPSGSADPMVKILSRMHGTGTPPRWMRERGHAPVVTGQAASASAAMDDSTLLARYEAMSEGLEKTAFLRRHGKALMRADRARRAR